jgi:hypothetical protein
MEQKAVMSKKIRKETKEISGEKKEEIEETRVSTGEELLSLLSDDNKSGAQEDNEVEVDLVFLTTKYKQSYLYTLKEDRIIDLQKGMTRERKTIGNQISSQPPEGS